MKCCPLMNITRQAEARRETERRQHSAKIEPLARALAREFYTGKGEKDVDLEVDCCWFDWVDTAKELLKELKEA